LLPHEAGDDYIALTKSAIDQMQKSYLDNKESDAYQNEKLMYHVLKKCIELNDNEYAEIAVGYIAKIKQSKEYKNNKSYFNNLDNYEIVASNCANNVATQNFDEFNNALLNLEKSADEDTMTINDRLNNYYTIMVMYSSYPNNLKDSYSKINEIGKKAKAIIDSNLGSEELTFNNIISMYELAASSMYNNAVVSIENKEEMYLNCIEWFNYLDDLNDDLNETLFLKKANAYKGLFDVYNDSTSVGGINKNALEYLDTAISMYNQIIRNNPDSFLAYVYLTQAHLDKQLIKPEAERNYTEVLNVYQKVLELKNNNKNLSSVALSQFSAVKKQMQSVGLEG
jgi:hypothetical protein